MRIYFDVKLSKPQKTFLPTAIFFARKDYEGDNDIPSNDVIMLEGLECESAPFDKDKPSKEWSIRWKGVTMESDKNYDEDFTLEELMALIGDKRLVNMEANLDHDTIVNILGVTIYQNNEKYDISTDKINEISFDGI